MPKCSQGHLGSFIRLRRVILLRSDIPLEYLAKGELFSKNCYCLWQFEANKISRFCNISPKVRYAKHITIADGNHITLCAAKNITKKITTRKRVLFFSSSGSCFVLYRYKQGICMLNFDLFIENYPLETCSFATSFSFLISAKHR